MLVPNGRGRNRANVFRELDAILFDGRVPDHDDYGYDPRRGELLLLNRRDNFGAPCSLGKGSCRVLIFVLAGPRLLWRAGEPCALEQWRERPSAAPRSGGLARVSDHITLLMLVPAIANIRASGTLAQHDGGLSDISIGIRWDLRPFDHSGRLGVALVSSLSLPTGRDPNLAHTALAVDATGKGTAVASMGVSAELPTAPWFVRVDLVGAIPIPTFAGSWAWLSPTVDLTLTGGVRVISWLFLAANVRAGAQFPTAQQSAGYDSSVGAFAVFRPDPQWSLLFGANASLFVRGLGLNRTAPVSGSLGLRYAVW